MIALLLNLLIGPQALAPIGAPELQIGPSRPPQWRESAAGKVMKNSLEARLAQPFFNPIAANTVGPSGV